ncbi:MAG: 4-diphosphocytidyl-2C-methyl-D-erythritol kinase [Alphaproteobacteria bacterium]|nr:4-diphosphocytidyl-2C-methyl-D-erythritol kinase [Alphaproteobacteria bacterium]
MKFAELPLAEAEGAILAHGIKFGGQSLRKGRVLSACDVERLRQAGVAHVVGAKLEPTDVGEDAAAQALARAVSGPGLTTSAAFTGRCNLFAEAPGLLILDAARIDRLNLVDEAVTIATLPAYDALTPRQMVATIKIIPFAVPRPVLAACLAIAGEGDAPPIRLAPFRPRAVGLIQTRLPGTKESILDKSARTMGERIRRLGSTCAGERRCPHEAGILASEICATIAGHAELVLILGASAITDRRDVIPAAIADAGGVVEHFGMPVDPGNLLLLGRAGGVPVLGLPGCARSPKMNGFDWVLERLLADVPIGRAEIMRMGVGGLLKEIASRPLPRAEAVADVAPGLKRRPRIAAIVLAAGQSRRMGRNKLLAEIDGVPMVTRVVDAVLGSEVDRVVVVTGHEADQTAAALAGRAVTLAHNPDYASGLSTSLRAGVGALGEAIDAAFVCLGDMPRIRPEHLHRLIAAYDPVEGRAICVPTFAGRRGNPVLWGARFFADMARVAGDVGARHLIGENAEVVCEVAMGDGGVLLDIDTPEALAALGATA